MHRSQRCCGELLELTVDDIWQIAGAGDQRSDSCCYATYRAFINCFSSSSSSSSNFRDWHTVVGEIPWSSVPKTMMDCSASLYRGIIRPYISPCGGCYDPYLVMGSSEWVSVYTSDNGGFIYIANCFCYVHVIGEKSSSEVVTLSTDPSQVSVGSSLSLTVSALYTLCFKKVTPK